MSPVPSAESESPPEKHPCLPGKIEDSARAWSYRSGARPVVLHAADSTERTVSL